MVKEAVEFFSLLFQGEETGIFNFRTVFLLGKCGQIQLTSCSPALTTILKDTESTATDVSAAKETKIKMTSARTT